MLNFKNVMSNDMFLGSWRVFGSGNNIYADNRPKGILPTRLTNQSITGTNQEVTDVSVSATNGDLTLKRQGQADQTTSNIRNYVTSSTITFDSNQVSRPDETNHMNLVGEGQFLAWIGGKWVGTTPSTQAISNIEELQNVTKTVGTITQRSMELGSSNGGLDIKNPQYSTSGTGSGVLFYNTVNNEYELNTDVITNIELEEQMLRISKIDGNTYSFNDVLNLASSGVGMSNTALDNSYLIWKDLAGAWMSEEKVNTVSGNETNENLITASGVYKSLITKQDLITSTTDIICSGIFVYDNVDATNVNATNVITYDIESQTFDLGSGIISSGIIGSGTIRTLTVTNKVNTLSVGELTVDVLNYNPEIITTYEPYGVGGSGVLTVNGSGHNRIYTHCNVSSGVAQTINKIVMKDIPIRTTVELLLTTPDVTNMIISRNLIAVEDGRTYSPQPEEYSTRISFSTDVTFNNTSEILMKITYVRDDTTTGTNIPIYNITQEEYYPGGNFS